mgnify:CR=1 FL=1
MKLKSNIDKLKILTDALIDRDYLRSKVIDLFDKFCSDFPVEMSAWIVEKDMSVTSKKGSDKNSATNLNDVFSGIAKEKNIEMHKKAFLGESSVYTLEVNDKILLTKVMPASSSNELVFGFSMDITSFVKTTNALHAHCENMDSNTCDLIKEVKDDDLYKLVNGK